MKNDWKNPELFSVMKENVFFSNK